MRLQSLIKTHSSSIQIDRVARCISVFLLLCLVGCGGSASLTSGPVSISAIEPSRLETINLPEANILSAIPLGNDRILALSTSTDSSIRLSLVDENMQLLWSSSLAQSYTLDQAGVHEFNGGLYLPVMHHQPNETSIYKVIRLDAKTGKTLDSNTLMRFGQHDRGELLADIRNADVPVRTAHASWSPDSSKFVILKYYPSSTGRLNMELMLFKRGFVLATKANIDFKFNAATQRMLALKLDNDGVAYLYLYNSADTSFEVGRFEILGSKQLRAIKYKSLAPPEVTRLDMGARGHAYIAYTAPSELLQSLTLVDFDFYLDKAKARSSNIQMRDHFSLNESPVHLRVLPLLDRIILSHESSQQSGQSEVKWVAYDLDLDQVYASSYTKPLEMIGRHAFYSTPKLVGEQLGHFFVENNTLRFRGVQVISGLTTYDAEYEKLAEVEGLYPALLDQAIARGNDLWILGNKLYRLTLPTR